MPDGGAVPVTEASRDEYVRHYIEYTLTTSIARQFDAFRSMVNKGPSWAGQSSARQPPRLAIFGPHLPYTLWRSHGATWLALGGCGAVSRPPQSRVFLALAVYFERRLGEN